MHEKSVQLHMIMYVNLRRHAPTQSRTRRPALKGMLGNMSIHFGQNGQT